MSAPKKGNRKFQIQLEVSAIEELKSLAKAKSEPSANAMAARIILEKIREMRSPKEAQAQKSSDSASDIDLRSLLLEAHRTIAELSRTISALAQEQKNAPDPAGAERSAASTAPSNPVAQRGRVRVITGLRQGSVD